MPTFVIEEHLLDWHTCHICHPLEKKLLLLLLLRIGESPSICPFLKYNRVEAQKGLSPIIFSGMDMYEDFLRLKIHLNPNIIYFDRH